LYIVHNNIQVDLIGLIAISVERLAHLDAVRVVEHLEDLQLAVLVALVLENFFDGNSFTSLGNCCFENDTERAISNNFFSVVSKGLLLK
jgi:hypothetical protein